MLVLELHVNQNESPSTTKIGPVSQNQMTTLILEQAETLTDHVSRVVFPAFSLDRGEGCEIHENAYGTCRPISDSERTEQRTRVLGVSSTS